MGKAIRIHSLSKKKKSLSRMMGPPGCPQNDSLSSVAYDFPAWRW